MSEERPLQGTLKSCAKLDCEFLVMFTGGWFHVDTHGIDTSDHEAAPRVEEVPKFELGDRVTFEARHVLYRGQDEKYRDVWRELVDRGSKTWFEQSLPETLTGVIVGKRAGKNGYTSKGGWDEPVGFEFSSDNETVTYYLVAYDLHRKIEKVFPNRLKKVEL